MTDLANQSTKTVVGRVVSNKMDKTVVVLRTVKKQHPRYGKYVESRTRFYAHDADNTCSIGDVVEIEMCRPISKTKAWVVRQIVERAEQEQI